MAYCTQDDILLKMYEDELIGLTDMTDSDEVGQDVLNRAIDDADAEIDMYCQNRYLVPFFPVPDIIRKIAVTLTIYNLTTTDRGGASDDRQRRRDQAVLILAQIENGELDLGDDVAIAEDASSAVSVNVTAEDRVFTKETLAGF